MKPFILIFAEFYKVNFDPIHHLRKNSLWKALSISVLSDLIWFDTVFENYFRAPHFLLIWLMNPLSGSANDKCRNSLITNDDAHRWETRWISRSKSYVFYVATFQRNILCFFSPTWNRFQALTSMSFIALISTRKDNSHYATYTEKKSRFENH